jgi:hypothetical protein
LQLKNLSSNILFMPRKSAAHAELPQTTPTKAHRGRPKGWRKNAAGATARHTGLPETTIEELLEQIFPATLLGMITTHMAEAVNRGKLNGPKLAELVAQHKTSVESYFGTIEHMAKSIRPKAMGAAA